MNIIYQEFDKWLYGHGMSWEYSTGDMEESFEAGWNRALEYYEQVSEDNRISIEKALAGDSQVMSGE